MFHAIILLCFYIVGKSQSMIVKDLPPVDIVEGPYVLSDRTTSNSTATCDDTRGNETLKALPQPDNSPLIIELPESL